MHQQFWVSKNIKLILTWGLLFSFLFTAVSFLLPRQYSAGTSVLIITRDRGATDPYTQLKGAERVGENLSQIMKTVDFYNKVMASGLEFDRTAWQKLTERKQRKQWEKDVNASMVYNSSLLQITVYAATKDNARALALAVTETLTKQGWEYVGSDIVIKSVNSPLVSTLPVRPNILLNALIGLIIGVTLSSWWVARYNQ